MASNFSDYLDIDDIMATQQSVSCKFEMEVPKLGMFDFAHDRKDIAAGTKLDLPCWLAQSLSTSRHRTVTVEIPKIYRSLHRNILQADAQIVCLPKFSLYYYDFGLHMLQFAGPESRQIFETLLQTFTSRFRMLMDKSNNFDVEEKLMHLDKSEKTIYDSARKCAIDFSDWRTRKTEKIVPTSAAVIRAKRKFDSIDKDFLSFFFKRLRKNDTTRYTGKFPYISLCGRERNFLRCEDTPIVYTKVVKTDDCDFERLAYCNSHDSLSFKFDPWKIGVDTKSGRVYYPTDENLGGLGLVAWPLAAELSKFFIFDENKMPVKIKWHEEEYDLSGELVSRLKRRRT